MKRILVLLSLVLGFLHSAATAVGIIRAVRGRNRSSVVIGHSRHVV